MIYSIDCTDKQQEVIDMRAEGMTTSEISKILNIWPQSVKRRLQRAKKLTLLELKLKCAKNRRKSET